MPKVYLSERERTAAQQDRLLSAVLRKEIHGKMTHSELADKTQFSRPKIQKALDYPQKIRLDDLRKICNIAGLELVVTIKIPE